ncbi:MAG: sigma-70 family RNA polymerase sigma factor [Spirochaetaceae bacterium]|jgi:RNA polymerase sigma-70 factor (ECF subfamily)|nr:sigma-70 family RNA polymerase sigma factor [Spirochaetaceae bacterium]
MKSGIDIASWYVKYFPMVLRRTRSMLRNEDDAFDAAQDVFERALSARNRLKDAFPSALLYMMATRICLNRLRRKSRQGRVVTDADFDETLHPSEDRGFAQAEAEITVKAILKQASAETRLMLWLYYVDGLSLEETGKVLGLSVSGVRKRILKCKERFGGKA